MVLGVFLAYMAGAIYGILFALDKGLDSRSVLAIRSPIWTFYDVNARLFQEFPYRTQVSLTAFKHNVIGSKEMFDQ